MEKNSDRVNFSFGMKIPGPVQFSSFTFSCSYSTDLMPEETPEDAIDRVRKLVMAEVEKDYNAHRDDSQRDVGDDSEFAAEISKKSEGGKSRRKKEDEED